MTSHLRLVSDQDVLESCGAVEPRKVTVTMRQLLPLLIDAVRANRKWLDDFSDDTVEVSPDLFEVLVAYKELRRSA